MPPFAYPCDEEAADVELLGPAGWGYADRAVRRRAGGGTSSAAASATERAATCDRHASPELTALGPNAYNPGAGALVVDIAGDCLSTSAVREALVDAGCPGVHWRTRRGAGRRGGRRVGVAAAEDGMTGLRIVTATSPSQLGGRYSSRCLPYALATGTRSASAPRERGATSPGHHRPCSGTVFSATSSGAGDEPTALVATHDLGGPGTCVSADSGDEVVTRARNDVGADRGRVAEDEMPVDEEAEWRSDEQNGSEGVVQARVDDAIDTCHPCGEAAPAPAAPPPAARSPRRWSGC